MISELMSNSCKYTGYQLVGICSLCGGDVVVPSVFLSVTPPVPTCNKCGATQKKPKWPVIEMENPVNKTELS